jgi:adenosyl cobinamide kinase/adenosyl cobinamide phosphate guanylyltransferase
MTDPLPSGMTGPVVDHEVLDMIADRLNRRTDHWQASREDDRVEFTDPDSGQRYEIVVRAILTDFSGGDS